MNSNKKKLLDYPEYGEFFQMTCGCYGGLPCYWSSKGTPSSNDNEEIIFEIKHSLVLINNFSITPYRSYFQPNYPVYAPFATQLIFLLEDKVTPYYESPIYEVLHEGYEQNFELPNPILFCGGFIKLKLIGKRQPQTVGDEEYYTCLSHVQLTGGILYSSHSTFHPANNNNNNNNNNYHHQQPYFEIKYETNEETKDSL